MLSTQIATVENIPGYKMSWKVKGKNKVTAVIGILDDRGFFPQIDFLNSVLLFTIFLLEYAIYNIYKLQ